MASFTSQVSFVLPFLLFAATFDGNKCGTNSSIRCNNNDQRLLLIFREGAVDPSNKLTSWAGEEDCCSWVGVLCNNDTGRVTGLHLAGQGLRAKFFAALKYLDFAMNPELTINDLHWLYQLSSLEYLDLSYIDIGNESKWLRYMDMLPSLSELHLRGCGLRDYPFLNHVNFTKLVSLDLSINPLHNSFFNFTRDIFDLDLSRNNLHGQVYVFDPDWIPQFQLKDLDMGKTSIGPNVLTWLYWQRSPQYLDISRSGISTIDANVFWSFLAGIDVVDISNNLIGDDISNWASGELVVLSSSSEHGDSFFDG
ncbi:receptor-like protein EIX1 [Neltuma alba]|uniref:receptor-like protein EIX1 n=1 Tax=Neltuma alba TaxID=207710 RepID=UPI0010A354BE|nr:receptor-like protein EIX1 [Prosopis alba]